MGAQTLQILLAGSRCTNILAAALVVSSVFAALLHMGHDHVESSFPLVADSVRLLSKILPIEGALALLPMIWDMRRSLQKVNSTFPSILAMRCSSKLNDHDHA